MSDVVPPKVTRPLLESAIERSRLFERLDAARSRQGVWIEAPPGAGKTILAASYLSSRDLPCLWYRIDATDNDVGSFLHHMSLAAGILCSAAPELPRLGPEHTGGLEVFARSYFRRLFASVPARILVLDDYHAVGEGSPLHEVLAIGVAEAPAGHHVMILSRARPPMAYARLQSERALELLSPQSFLLSEDETAALCRRFGEVHGLEITAEACTALHRRCEGWVTGLVLMLEAWRTRGLALEHVVGAVPAVVFDYFASEILGRAEPDTERVLLSTAMLEDITAELAVTLSGVDDAARRLDHLSSRGQFIVRNLGQPPSWTCHQLFRQFLARQAEHQLGAGAWSALRSEAAGALAAGGRLERAIELYGQLQAWEQLAALLCQHAPRLLAQGRGLSLLGWCEEIPGALQARSPWLLYWAAVARMPTDPPLARAGFEEALALFQAAGDIRGAFLAWAMSVQNIFFEQADYGSFGAKVLEIEPLLQRHELPDETVEAVVHASLALCVLLHDLEHPRRERWIERALALQDRLPDLGARIQFMALAHASFIFAGETSRSQHVLQTLHGLVAAAPTSPLAYTVFKGVQGLDHWTRAEFEQSLAAVREGLATAETTGAVVLVPLLLSVAEGNALSLGDRQRAEQDSALLEAHLSPGRRNDHGFHLLGRGWAATLAGEWHAADEWLERATAMMEPLGSQIYLAEVDIMHAVVRHHLGDREGSDAALARARARVGSHGRWPLYGAALAEAEIALDRGQRDAALAALREGLAIGRESRLWNFTGWRREVLSRLCAEALAAEIEVSYTVALIERHDLLPPLDAGIDLERWPWPLVVRCLGGLELVRGGHPVRFSGKLPRKPLQLLELLVIHGGSQVPEDRLADALWPDAEGDAAISALSTTIGRLRQLLEVKELLVRRNRCLTLDRRRCRVDAWTLEDELSALAGLTGLTEEELDAAAAGALMVMELWRGEFVPQSDLPQTLGYRQRLLRRTVEALEGAAGRLEAAGRGAQAGAVAARARELAAAL